MKSGSSAGRASAARGLLIAVCALLTAPAVGDAQVRPALEVSPTNAELGSNARMAAFTVRNNAEAPKTLTVSLYRWTQGADGQDHLATTDDLLMLPPTFQLDGGAKQVLRLGARSENHDVTERAYRAIISEIPPANGGAQIGVALRLSVPIFIAPTNAPKPTLVVTLRRIDASKADLALQNTGVVHVRLDSVRITDETGVDKTPLTSTLSSDVLAGATFHQRVTVPRGVSVPQRAAIQLGTQFGMVTETIDTAMR